MAFNTRGETGEQKAASIARVLSPVHVHGDGHHDLAVVRPRAAAPGPDTGLHTLPLGAPVLEPDLHLDTDVVLYRDQDM